MSVLEWAALITAVTGLLAVIGGGCKWLIDLILAQSRSTITELREENTELETENRDLRDQLTGRGGTA